jgi:hypothetical protein
MRARKPLASPFDAPGDTVFHLDVGEFVEGLQEFLDVRTRLGG